MPFSEVGYKFIVTGNPQHLSDVTQEKFMFRSCKVLLGAPDSGEAVI